MATLLVIKPGLQTTIQDRGRWGFQWLGVPVAGPMDPCSHRLANALVGNDAINDAALRQLGIIRVSSLEDLLTTAGLAGYTEPLPGRRNIVVTYRQDWPAYNDAQTHEKDRFQILLNDLCSGIAEPLGY